MSSESPSPSQSDYDRVARMRDDGRAARLSFSNYAEHRVRSEFKEEAVKKCGKEIKEFAECAKEKGLMVVISCRKLNRAITECMYIHNSDEAFQKYLEANPGLIEQRTLKSKP